MTMHRLARHSILQNSFLYFSVRVTPAPSHESLDSIPSVSEVSSMELGVSETVEDHLYVDVVVFLVTRGISTGEAKR